MTTEQISIQNIIAESGHDLLTLINDILDVSKIEAGKLTLDINDVDIGEISRATLRLIKQQAAQKSLKVTYSQDDRLVHCRADGRRLKQMLVNLLSNAVKFTPENGEIGLDVALEADGSALRFTVWDTGIGIKPEMMPMLFQPFVQLDSALSRKHAGTGLGLALVKKLAELHGGGVRVESEQEKGSRFSIILPVDAKAAANSVGGETAKPTPVPAGNASVVTESMSADEDQDIAPQVVVPNEAALACILLAEDNEINRKAVSDYLTAKGYQVIPAVNGFEAIQRACQHPPDLILMDIQMPEFDGLEAIHNLRAIPALASTPIIAVTALAMSGDRERCLAAGADEYVAKPVDLKALECTIRKILQAHQ